jgi:uncharacterized repeat protein (TIGR01451 family)
MPGNLSGPYGLGGGENAFSVLCPDQAGAAMKQSKTHGRSTTRIMVAAVATMLATVSVAVLPPSIAGAATRIVSNCDPSGPGSLSAAVAAAASGDLINFSVSCPAATPITPTSTLDITTDLTIMGPGPGPDQVVVNGAGAITVFDVSPGVTASISEITIENGTTGVGCAFGCAASGGGIENDGSLTLSDTVVSDNTSDTGCDGFCGATGGGVENNDSLTVIDSTFTGNNATANCGFQCGGNGGAIENNGSLNVTGSTFTDNSANGPGTGCVVSCAATGGAIENAAGATATVTNSTLDDNSALLGCTDDCGASGGGIDNAGTLSVTNSILDDNSAGAFCVEDCAPFGGGIANESSGTLTLTGSTLSANSAATGCTSGCNPMGGGLYNDGSATVGGSTIVGSALLGHDCFLATPLNDLGTNRDDDGTCFIPGGGEQLRAVIEVSTSPSYAGDPVLIASSQLQSSCQGHITFETLQGGSTVAPRTSANSITVILDDDGDATVVVTGSNCAPGTDVIDSDLTVAPYLTAITTVVVEPSQTSAAGVVASPSTEVETGDTAASGNSDVYAVFTVETDPVYAEQPVEISAPELENRCGGGWRFEPGTGTTINQTSGTTVASGILDDDGNASFVFKGRSCAAGPSTVIADVLAGTHPTYVTTFTVSAPQSSFPTAGAMRATVVKATKSKATKTRAAKHHKGHKGGGTGSGSGSGSGTGAGTPTMSLTASPNPLVLTGAPTPPPPTTPPALLTITKTDENGGEVDCGNDITFAITVTNNGPGALDGVVVSDDLLGNPDFTGDSYTAAEVFGATGASGAGGPVNGNIDDTVDLPADSSIIYTVTATTSIESMVPADSNTATATPPASTALASGSITTATDDFTVACGG